jgi:ubiquinone/menaquinone biosynthesis C-methylase UbiE
MVHAHFWEAPQLGEFKWLRSIADDAVTKSALFGAMLPRFEERWAECVTPQFLRAARLFTDAYAGHFQEWSVGPRTLTHGDFRADNFAFAADGGLTIFDWQVALCSMGARDLAYFLAGSLSTGQRRETEKSLVELYYETLLAGGVRGYSRGELDRDLRRGLGSPLSVWVIAGGLLDFSSERGSALLKQTLERVGSAMEDYGFAEYLEEIASPRIHAVETHERYSGGYAPFILQALAKREALRDAAFFLPYLKPGMRILDCGCGPGGISLGLAAYVPDGQVVGIDVEGGQLEMGREQARVRGIDNVRFERASVYKLPFADASFDAVLAHAVLYHLGEPAQALQELLRVLKPGGWIGVRDTDIGGDVYAPANPALDRFWTLAEQVIRHSGGDMRFGRRQRKVLREAGFVDVVGSASCDSFGTPEETVGFSKYWTDVFLAQHCGVIVEQGWATAMELDEMRDALLEWGRGADAFYSRCRCEAVGRKP